MIANERDTQKHNYLSTQNWSTQSTHYLGAIGELTLTLETGIPFDNSLRAAGDPGYDILYNGISYDGKAVTHPSPDLKEMPDRIKRSMRYVLISTDGEKYSKVIGWVTRKQLEDAPLTNYNHGNMRSIPWFELIEMQQIGMPPELPNDHIKGVIEAQKILMPIAIV